MAHVKNIATTEMLTVQISETPNPDQRAGAWIGINPGDTYYVNPKPLYWNFIGNRDAKDYYWSGKLRNEDWVEANPETRQVEIIRMEITLADLNKYKALYPDDPAIQAVTLDQLIEKSRGKDHRGDAAEQKHGLFPRDPLLTPCELAWGGVAVDVVCVILGYVGIREKVNGKSLSDIVTLIKDWDNISDKSAFQEAAKILASDSATLWDRAKAVKDIGMLLYTANMIEAIIKAIFSSLTWWDAVLYGTLSMAELAAAFLTDGAALVAAVAAEIVLFAFLATDTKNMLETCGYISKQSDV
jgi:hypothetical protein